MDGALLNIDITPVGVGLGVVAVQDVVGKEFPLSSSDSMAAAGAELVSSGSRLVKLSKGQHSARSSEQLTKGTSIEPPSGDVNIVNRAIAHLRNKSAYKHSGSGVRTSQQPKPDL